MRVVVLGCATSTGVPVIGCKCDVCSSGDPRNKRTRSSLFVNARGKNILIDTSPDLRFQALASGVCSIDFVLYTHSHADHTHGIDDLRIFNFLKKTPIPCFGNRYTVENIRRSFSYIFDGTHSSGGKPQLDLKVIEEEFEVEGVRVQPIEVNHDNLIIYGYRIGNLAYITDCSGIPPRSLEKLRGLDVLIIGALRNRPHPAHFSVEEALTAISQIKPKRAFLTHMGHELEYNELAGRLPAGVMPAYDGLILALEE
jgi:phosphoribosyl 1,2-cyclic phosphate phosphodiesterase